MDKFNFKHLFFIICSVTVASLKTYPEIFTRLAGRDSWICTILASIIFILFADYIIKLYVNNEYENLYDIFTVALGKYLGKASLSLFAFMLFLSMIESAAAEASVIHYNLFIESPVWYILLFIIPSGIYVMMKGKNALMVVLIVCMLISIVNGAFIYFLTYSNRKYKLLFPVFEDGLSFKFFIATVKVLGLYASASIALPCLSLLKKNRKLRSLTFASNVFVTQMNIIAITGIFSTFTPERASTIIFPKIIQSQLAIPIGFITSGEFYIIFQTISAWSTKYTVTFFALLIILKELNVGRVFNIKYLIYCISVIVYILAYSLSINLSILFRFFNLYDYACVIGYLILPLFVFFIYGIRVKKSFTETN